MPWQEAHRLIIPIAQAPDYTHGQGAIHRDVKHPNNLLGEKDWLMLTDFGVAKVMEEEATIDLTGTAMAVSAPKYMAPEHAPSKKGDHRAEIYSLGIVLYEMVTGHKPFMADTPLVVLIKQAGGSLTATKAVCARFTRIR
jgi:serine/threonine protein kinase